MHVKKTLSNNNWFYESKDKTGEVEMFLNTRPFSIDKYTFVFCCFKFARQIFIILPEKETYNTGKSFGIDDRHDNNKATNLNVLGQDEDETPIIADDKDSYREALKKLVPPVIEMSKYIVKNAAMEAYHFT